MLPREKLCIIGAGGFGSEVYDLACDIRDYYIKKSIAFLHFGAIGFIDNIPNKRRDLIAKKLIDQSISIETFEDHDFTNRDNRYIIAINDPQNRRDVVNRLPDNLQYYYLQHPSAVVSPSANIGTGVIICANSFVGPNTRLRDHTHVNVLCSIGHDTSIGRFTTLCPGTKISGNCIVDETVFFGSNAVVASGIEVGEEVKVGAGAVVLNNVEDGQFVVGVPAKPK